MSHVSRVRFDPFEFDLTTLELFKGGRRVPLAPKPSGALALLVHNAGSLVTRADLQAHLWPDTVVELDQSLNSCVRQLRAALGDDAEAPIFVETVSRRGYRFAAAVRHVEPRSRRRRSLPMWAAAATLAFGLAAWFGFRSDQPTRPVRLAVLPLDVIGGDATDRLFGEGLTEEIISTLGKADPSELQVLARTSSYRAREFSLEEIRDQLDVEYVVQGRVRPETAGHKLTLQLVNTSTRTAEWSGEFRRAKAGSPVPAQETLAQRVARGLEEPLEVTIALPPESPPPSNLTTEWLIARHFLETGGEEERRRAAEIVEKLVEAAPAFGPAWAARARLLIDSGRLDDAALAIEDGSHVVGLNPQLALERGRLRLRQWNLEGAGPDLLAASTARPQLARAHHAYAYYLSVIGRHDESLRLMEQARALDPISASVLGDTGLFAFWARRPEEALEQCRRAQSFVLERFRLMVDRCLLHNLVATGHWSEALDHADRVVAASGASEEERNRLLGGRSSEERLRSYFMWAASPDHLAFSQGGVDSYRKALAHAGAGQIEQALTALEAALANRAPRLIEIGVEPRLDPLRGESRFLTVVRQVGLPAS